MQSIKERLAGLRLRLAVFYAGVLLAIFSGIYLWSLYEGFMNYRETERQNLQYDARTMAGRLENYIEQTDAILLDAVSDEAVIEALKELNRMEDTDPARIYELTNKISDCIVTESAIRMLHRLSVFTAEGFFVTTNVDRKQETGRAIRELRWLSKARREKGKRVLLPPSQDVFSQEEKEKVVSLARLIRDPGKEIGFIEAQMDYGKIEEICEAGQDCRVTVSDQAGNLFYSNLSEEGRKEWENDTQVLWAEAISENTGLVCRLGRRVSFDASNFGTLRDTGLVLLTALALCSVALVSAWIYKMLKPLVGLKEALERTDVDTLQENQNLNIAGTKIREVQSLITSFEKMSLRLRDSMERERRTCQSQMDAKFEMLQAQINPHFMHNMLNVIANMVYENQAGEVPEICNRLSENIRYSTASGEAKVSLKEELKFAENYLTLMKKRLEHKLEYQITVSNPDTEKILLPRLSLIPFIENAVCHPYYESGKKVICVTVEAGGNKDGWFVRIEDNGRGFQEGQKRELEKRMEKYLEKLKGGDVLPELSIGGLGIVNTYARLKLYGGAGISLELLDARRGGAGILIKGGGGENVPYSDCRR